jgi:TonB family protein
MTRIIGAALLGIAMANGVAAQSSPSGTWVMVSGEVKGPSHPITTQPITLSAAIAQTGGYTAAAEVVEIRRRSSGAGPVTSETPSNEYRVQYVIRPDLVGHAEPDPALTGGEFIVVRPGLYIHSPAPKGQFGAGGYRLQYTTWGVTAPTVLTSKEPQYTAAGMAAKLQGTVDLEVLVNADGTVGDARVLKGLDALLPDIVAGLDANAIECVKTWTFVPGTILGRPTPIIQPVSVQFKLR